LAGAKNKKQGSVRKRIFLSNAIMILVTICACLVIGIVCVKIYWEKEETALHGMLSGISAKEAEALIENLTVHNSLFILMAGIFTLLSAAAMIIISRIYTGMLTKKIMQPLELLEQGADRIKAGDYSVPVAYEGDIEFEQVCSAFNSMQQHLREEKEKNARYEKARQEMIAGISHDLRNPLTTIRGSVKGILDGVISTPEDQKKFLEAAYRRSGDMDKLLGELFYFSKLETGGIPVHMQELDLRQYLGNYCRTKKDLQEYSGVEFVCDFPEDMLSPVKADPEILQRILDNVLSNSMKYAGVSPLRILVQLRGKDGRQEVILQDNGTGVPEDKLGRIFDEFYRADESRGRKGGSGLGLYIVKCLSEAMGGHVSADMESRCEGFTGLAVKIKLVEERTEDGKEGQDSHN
jgi:signal transduction histidine kinase